MKRTLAVLAVLVAATAAGAYWYIDSKQPQRAGELSLSSLQAPVTVDYDERGVPHIQAQNEADMYRALGIREHADRYAAKMDMNTPASKALQAYLDGINQYQASRPAPIEFDVLGIEKRPFTTADTLSVAGYMAYSFAAAFRTEPVLTHIRDQLGADYLKAFDLDWHPQGVVGQNLAAADWQDLNAIAELSHAALLNAGLPQFEGSNAWAISGSRTASGKPLLAGDPHIRFAVPSVWCEANLSYPGFSLYGHHQALNPV